MAKRRQTKDMGALRTNRGRSKQRGKLIITRETGLSALSPQATMRLEEEEELVEYKMVKERARTATSRQEKSSLSQGLGEARNRLMAKEKHIKFTEERCSGLVQNLKEVQTRI